MSDGVLDERGHLALEVGDDAEQVLLLQLLLLDGGRHPALVLGLTHLLHVRGELVAKRSLREGGREGEESVTSNQDVHVQGQLQ